MAATETSTAGEQLAALEEAARDAERRLQQTNADRSSATRALRGAEDARLALEERRGAGEDVPKEEIAEAIEAIEVAREAADERVWNARRDGAERAVDEAVLARDEFGRENFALIAAEEAPLDGPARDALAEAWEVLQAAANGYALRARRWHHLARYGGIPIAEIPNGTPLRGDIDELVRRFESGLEIPTPRTLRR
jgi:hypothetical protein